MPDRMSDTYQPGKETELRLKCLDDKCNLLGMQSALYMLEDSKSPKDKLYKQKENPQLSHCCKCRQDKELQSQLLKGNSSPRDILVLWAGCSCPRLTSGIGTQLHMVSTWQHQNRSNNRWDIHK